MAYQNENSSLLDCTQHNSTSQDNKLKGTKEGLTYILKPDSGSQGMGLRLVNRYASKCGVASSPFRNEFSSKTYGHSFICYTRIPKVYLAKIHHESYEA
jgi:hypothetical protein